MRKEPAGMHADASCTASQENCKARKDSVNNFIRVLVSSIAFALLGLPAVLLSADANFFSGKTIRIVVGTSPGGGFDVYSRTLARHMGKYIAGNPAFLVENMPGAGHR